ncbi:ATP-binding protein [Paraburkholderia sp. SIMBA_061]|jgi:two-component system OmpR family sensor kinase|uniref:ATP-binding protein n=1 Tax=Paraburkholderia graminis TaxID=60548 RepID=UPI00149470E2
MKSVRTQLLVGLILVLGAMSGLAGYGIFRSALEEANELFDYELRSVAISLPQSVADTELASSASGELEGLQEDRVAIQIWDASNVLTYESVPSAKLPRLHAGFQSIEVGERHYRVFGLQQASRFIQVGQPLSVRDEAALKQASRTLWPLLAVLPFEIALVLLVVKRALRPVTIISRSLAARSIETLAPIGMAHSVPTEIEPLVEALNDLLIRLDKALHAQRVFVADAAHELRTPLAALKLQIQVARQHHAQLRDEDLLRKLEDRVNRAIHLVQQLLTLAREDAEASARAGNADLRRVATQVVSDISVMAEHKGIDLGLDCTGLAGLEVPIVVIGDDSSLTTMVTNLVDNAIRYTPRGGQVDVRIFASDMEVTLEVVDNGPGIPEADLERVFDRFYRAGNTTGQGSGLGLAIAAKVAAKHHARFSLRNRTDGQGLKVSVTGLRRVRADAPAMGRSSTAPREPSGRTRS